MSQPQGCFNFPVYALATLFIEETGMARLTKWGNSVGGLRLPKAIIQASGLRVGDELSCRLLDSGAILLTPTGVRVAIETEGDSIVMPSVPKEKW